MSEEKATEKNVKKRHWAFCTYPDSAPTDWISRLQKSGLKYAISPLHDKDINADGTPKKHHWHVIASYDGPTTFSNVKKLTESLNAPRPEPLEAVRGYYRYLIHRDNPEKYQYDENGITIVNGFNIADFVELTKSEVNAIKRRLVGIIRSSDITEYSHLIYLLVDNEMFLEFDVASGHTYFFNEFIKSRRHVGAPTTPSPPKPTKGSVLNPHPKVDPDTGEVLE